MAFQPLDWYCRPLAMEFWADTSFGAYTPCAIDSLVISISYLVLLLLCLYRIWLIKSNHKAKRFQLRTTYYHYMLGLMAAYCIAEPLLRLVMGISIFNLDGQTGLPPFEIVSLIIEALAWFFMLIMIGLETKVYIREFRWYVRFGVIYVLVANAVIFNLILSMWEHCKRSAHYLFISAICCQVLFGILLLVYIPNLDPHMGYTMIQAESSGNGEYEALTGGEQICPERNASWFSNPKTSSKRKETQVKTIKRNVRSVDNHISKTEARRLIETHRLVKDTNGSP